MLSWVSSGPQPPLSQNPAYAPAERMTFFHEIKCNVMTNFMDFNKGILLWLIIRLVHSLSPPWQSHAECCQETVLSQFMADLHYSAPSLYEILDLPLLSSSNQNDACWQHHPHNAIIE